MPIRPAEGRKSQLTSSKSGRKRHAPRQIFRGNRFVASPALPFQCLPCPALQAASACATTRSDSFSRMMRVMSGAGSWRPALWSSLPWSRVTLIVYPPLSLALQLCDGSACTCLREVSYRLLGAVLRACDAPASVPSPFLLSLLPFLFPFADPLRRCAHSLPHPLLLPLLCRSNRVTEACVNDCGASLRSINQGSVNESSPALC